MKIAIDCRFLYKPIGMARVNYNLLLSYINSSEFRKHEMFLLFDKEIDEDESATCC